MFNVIRTRKGRLEQKLVNEFSKKDIEQLIAIFDEYEKDNLNTIEKLRRVKKIELNKINGALRQTINAHGPITMQLIGSCSKRIYGSLLDNYNKKTIIKFSPADFFNGFIIGVTVILFMFLVIYFV
jgi:hypothetical protein